MFRLIWTVAMITTVSYAGSIGAREIIYESESDTSFRLDTSRLARNSTPTWSTASRPTSSA